MTEAKVFRWTVLVLVVLVFLAAAHMGRYTDLGSDRGLVLDRWKGEVCHIRSGTCVPVGEPR